MRVVIESIPHKDQAYNTCGDWRWELGTLRITVSQMPQAERSEWLVAIHELVEAFLCKSAGVEEADVTGWDKAYEAAGGEGEPGAQPGAPYRSQHEVAETVERLVCWAAGVPWLQHDKAVEEVCK